MQWLVSVLLLTAGCATAGYQISPPGSNAVGYTDCEQRGDFAHPRAWVDVEVLASPDSAFVIQHERKHMEQVRRHETCWDWRVWYMSNAAEAEAEAFCAGARTEPDFTEGLIKSARWLSVGYPNLRLSFGEALVLITKYCTEAQP